ncbi:putative membrane protein [Wickerhamomyces ciferrii]|uniref:Membrane protein n=1 Tax=Wickerhamomyces ciferrii (strain ATCC 14091 / BCRC 22168 / CBS 111 / JCM 3599 / NBRC 0793 / NRRL Y-1031 F-60-10) TaxID=1206466 RepID=K0KM81_WICCF|nr:uncharacterized protein BN7_5953 [Wickerhamomyces ciferrii]CCH46360.1 putative membrane protein [Wickerhamomyces ciferrii]
MITIDPRPECFKNWLHEASIVFLIMLAQLLNQAGTCQTLPMMNILEHSFNNVTANDKVWFMAACPLTAGAFILISGKFGDLYGLKKTLLVGISWGCIWTLLVGISSYSHSVIFFCICRAMQGIGLALILPNAIGIAGNLYPNGQRKAIVFSLIAAAAPTGATLGSVFGALTSQFGQWEWNFYSNAIVLFLMGIATYFVIPHIEPHHTSSKMDWWGAITGVSGLIMFNFAWNQAPAAGWDSPYIIVLLIAGLISLGAFFYVENSVAESPILPTEVMNSHLLLILLVIAFGWSSFSIWTFYYWAFLMNLNHYTPLLACATYGNFLFWGITACVVVSLLIRKVNPSYLLLAAMGAFFVGIAMLATTPVHQTYFNMLFAQMIVLSFGMDMSFPAASLVLSDTLPKKHQGMASSLVSTMINYSMSVGLGIAGTAEAKIKERTGDLLQSYRAAMYVGIGLASVAILLGIVLVISSHLWPHHIPEDKEYENSYNSELNTGKDTNEKQLSDNAV